MVLHEHISDRSLLECAAGKRRQRPGGFTIEKDYQDRWFFRRLGGRAVPACGYRPEDVTDSDLETVGEYFDGRASAEVLRASAETSRHSVEGWMVSEPRAEVYWSASKFARQALPRKRAVSWEGPCRTVFPRASSLAIQDNP